VWFQKISIASPWMVTGNSEGVRVSKAKTFKRNYEAKLDIFWNHTLATEN